MGTIRTLIGAALLLTLGAGRAPAQAVSDTPAGTHRLDPASIETNYPDPAHDFDAALAGPEFLGAARFPQMTFAGTGSWRPGRARPMSPATSRCMG